MSLLFEARRSLSFKSQTAKSPRASNNPASAAAADVAVAVAVAVAVVCVCVRLFFFLFFFSFAYFIVPIIIYL